MPIGSDDELWLRLDAIPRLGPKKTEQLLQHIELKQLFRFSTVELQGLGLTAVQIQVLHGSSARIDSALQWLEAPSHQLLHLHHPLYPDSLRQIDSPPVILFVDGDARILGAPQLAIAGSRHGTSNGLRQATRLARELAQRGMIITSGLALGIDGAAHRGALEGGKTVAVVATGLDRVYPKRHIALAAQIRESGAIVSEFFPGTPPKAEFFPRRNRIISGLSCGVLVVEASIKSGTLITARYGAEQGREVFAVPGNVDNPLSEGPHMLIQQGAKLVSQVSDIIEELGHVEWLQRTVSPPVHENNLQQQLPFVGLLDTVDYETTDIDTVVERSNLPVAHVIMQLTELEILGEIAAVPGGYVRLRRHL